MFLGRLGVAVSVTRQCNIADAMTVNYIVINECLTGQHQTFKFLGGAVEAAKGLAERFHGQSCISGIDDKLGSIPAIICNALDIQDAAHINDVIKYPVIIHHITGCDNQRTFTPPLAVQFLEPVFLQ